MKLDKKLIQDIESQNISRIFVYFYEAWCSGTKLEIQFWDFDVQNLQQIETAYSFSVYVKPKEQKLLQDTTITRLQKADHSWVVKTRYMFASEKVQDRCGCGTSFAFEKKKPSIDFEKLKNLKRNFSQ